MMSNLYTIKKVQLPLVGGVAGHDFIAFFDPVGNLIRELHGLATDANGKIKPIGYLPSDKLKFFDIDKNTQDIGFFFISHLLSKK